MTFPVQMRRALPTLKIFSVLGILAAAAAVLHAALTEAEGKQPWALLILVLGLPAIWIVTVICLATFSLRVTDDRIEKLLAGRWVVASRSLEDLSSAKIAENTLELNFRDGSSIRIPAMPLRDRDGLARVLAERCPRARLE